MHIALALTINLALGVFASYFSRGCLPSYSFADSEHGPTAPDRFLLGTVRHLFAADCDFTKMLTLYDELTARKQLFYSLRKDYEKFNEHAFILYVLLLPVAFYFLTAFSFTSSPWYGILYAIGFILGYCFLPRFGAPAPIEEQPFPAYRQPPDEFESGAAFMSYWQGEIDVTTRAFNMRYDNIPVMMASAIEFRSIMIFGVAFIAALSAGGVI